MEPLEGGQISWSPVMEEQYLKGKKRLTSDKIISLLSSRLRASFQKEWGFLLIS